MEEKNIKALSRIQEEIDKINKKENHIYFFVIDTKGNPSGSLEYIYNLASILKDNDYNVTMLYQEENFVGVRDWLGDKYADLEHADISKGDVSVSPSDILFIPELFSNIMGQTKNLPCKRIVILQNYDYVLEQIPLSVQWGDYGIMEALVNTDINAELIKSIFPYIKTNVVTPYISPIFGTTLAPKKMIINIVAKDQRNVNRIVKPFYWKYPTYKWVSFRDLRGLSKEDFASALREAAITIWVDEDTNFGYSAIEAMKSGSIVIAKIPEIAQKWMESDEKDSVGLSNCCVWFDNFHSLHKQIASVVRAWTVDNVPNEIFEESKKVTEMFSYENTKDMLITYINGVLNNRKQEMEVLINQIKSQNSNNNEE
jgi:hypothetical protein